MAITADNPTVLSLAVAKHVVKNSKALGVATTVDFADALASGVQVAKRLGALMLSPNVIPESIQLFLKDSRRLTNVYVYGGLSHFDNRKHALLAS